MNLRVWPSMWKSPEVMVPILGLIYVSIILVYTMVTLNFSPFSLVFIPFIVLFLLCAYGVWRQSKIGYITTAVLSSIFLALEGTQIVQALGAVTIPDEFFSVVTSVPLLVAVLVYSILGLRQIRRKAIVQKPMRTIPASSFVILLVLGFMIGAITIGVVAAQTETRLLGSAGGGDITIVQGAGNQNNGQFYSPQTLTMKVGVTVTWTNHDGTAHSITSKGSSLFDSGGIPTGGSFKYTFTHPGTYNYYCTIHPWMTGIIVVALG
jgi:plastocyanin